MNTHGPSLSSIFFRPSHGDAGAYREPVRDRIWSLFTLISVLLIQGSSSPMPLCRTNFIPSRSKQNSANADSTPPEDPLYRTSGSDACPSQTSRTAPTSLLESYIASTGAGAFASTV